MTKYASQKLTNVVSTDTSIQNSAASTGGGYSTLITDASASPNIRTIDQATLYNNTAGIASLSMRIINSALTNNLIMVDINCSTGVSQVYINNMGFQPTTPLQTTTEIYPGVFITKDGNATGGFYNITFKDFVVPRGYLLQIKANTGLVSYHVVSSVRSVV